MKPGLRGPRPSLLSEFRVSASSVYLTSQLARGLEHNFKEHSSPHTDSITGINAHYDSILSLLNLTQVLTGGLRPTVSRFTLLVTASPKAQQGGLSTRELREQQGALMCVLMAPGILDPTLVFQ